MLKSILFFALVFVPFPVLADSTDQTGTYTVDPAVNDLIIDLGLRESAIASRDLPGWSPPRKIVVGWARPGSLAEYQAVAPGVEFVMVESVAQARKEAIDAQAVLGCKPGHDKWKQVVNQWPTHWLTGARRTCHCHDADVGQGDGYLLCEPVIGRMEAGNTA